MRNFGNRGVPEMGWDRVVLRGLDGFVATACERHMVRRDQVFSTSRIQPVSNARADIVVAFREQGISLPEIGRLLGIDHTTALYHLKRRGLVKAKPRETLTFPKEAVL